MNKLMMGLVLTAATTAFAQTSTTSMPSASSATPTPQQETLAPATTQTLTTKAEGKTSKFGVTLLWQNYTTAQEVRKNNSGAQISSDNGIGINYKPTDKLKVEARHRFAYTFVGDQDRLKGKSPYQLLDPTIHANYTSDLSLLGSNPIVFANRYYVPVSESSREATSRGTLRSSVSPSWDLNPRWNLSYMFQGYLYMYRDNQKKDAEGTVVGHGGDSELIFITGPNITYNFNDKVNAYYFLNSQTQSSKTLNRADFRADMVNMIANEVGGNFTVGAVEINPAVVYYLDGLNQAGYTGFDQDQNIEYDLNIVASF